MTAKIDIKTPAGKSLEGFPLKHNPCYTDIGKMDDKFVFYLYKNEEHTFRKWILTPGDTIMIEVL